MEMSQIDNGSQRAHDIFPVNKAGATECITGRSSARETILLHRLISVFVCSSVGSKQAGVTIHYTEC